MSLREKLVMKTLGNKVVIKILSIPIVLKVLTWLSKIFISIISLFKRKKKEG